MKSDERVYMYQLVCPCVYRSHSWWLTTRLCLRLSSCLFPSVSLCLFPCIHSASPHQSLINWQRSKEWKKKSCPCISQSTNVGVRMRSCESVNNTIHSGIKKKACYLSAAGCHSAKYSVNVSKITFTIELFFIHIYLHYFVYFFVHQQKRG